MVRRATALILLIVLALVLFVIGTALLLLGADWFMDGVGDLARTTGVSALVLGIVLAGLEPEEMLTAAIASAQGSPSLAVGDVIGTNVTMITLALGISALLVPLVLQRAVRRQALFATAISIAPIVVLFTGLVSRLAGICFLLLFVGYTLFLLRTDRDAIKRAAEELDDDDDDDDSLKTGKARLKLVALTLGGLIAMAAGGPALVYGARQMAQLAGLSEGVIGATIVSLATSAEIIVLAVTAARKQQPDILIGAIIGSFAYNLLVTLGLAAIIRPLTLEPRLLHIALPAMIIAHLALFASIWYGKIARISGCILILGYIAYVLLVSVH